MWVRGVGEVIEQNLDGSPRKAVGVNIDIQELRNAVIRAEDASRAKSEFLANMSHELRTPLTAILGYADLILEPSLAEVNTSSCAKTVKANADHLLTIINDILDMSKIEAGQMRVEIIAFDPVRLLEEVVNVLQPRALGKGISLAIEFDSPIPVVIHSDPTRLRQVLLNLAGNAVKFTEVGGVTLRVVCLPEGQSLRIDVIDTGIGMNAEQRAEISRFNAFTQADTSTTRRFGGTGLGLRISNTLAKMLGGGLEIKSEEGKGSVFSVTINTGCLEGIDLQQPQCAVKQSRAEQEEHDVAMAASGGHEAEPRLPLEGIRILLAEDGPDNQRLITFHLKKAGAEVKVVENGLLAAEWVEQTSATEGVDLILMDMQMPVLDGYGATRRLRASGCQLPIIALTAHAMEGDRQKCIEAGCDDYLTKPIDKSLLILTCQHAAINSARLQTS
jgi:CheY-like chemotaxis protein